MDYTKDLENLCEVVGEQIADITRKVRNSGMTTGDLDTIDKLTHAMKSIKGVMAMGDDGYSGRYPYYLDERGGVSMAGRRNAKRDSMGRYSRNDLSDKMRELMDDAPDERTRQEIRRLVEKLDNA